MLTPALFSAIFMLTIRSLTHGCFLQPFFGEVRHVPWKVVLPPFAGRGEGVVRAVEGAGQPESPRYHNPRLYQTSSVFGEKVQEIRRWICRSRIGRDFRLNGSHGEVSDGPRHPVSDFRELLRGVLHGPVCFQKFPDGFDDPGA